MNELWSRLSYILGRVEQRVEALEQRIDDAITVAKDNSDRLDKLLNRKPILTTSNLIGIAQVGFAAAGFIVTWHGGMLSFWTWLKRWALSQ